MKTARLFGCASALVLIMAARSYPLDPQLPILTLKYDGGYGSEESEETEEVEPASYRHTVLLRIREDLDDDLVLNLYSALSRKTYLSEAGSYLYWYLNPDAAWYIGERVKWYTGLRGKWAFYDELDSEGKIKDYGSYLARTDLTFRPGDRLKLIPSIQGVWDVYRNGEKSAQTYTAGMNVSSQIGRWDLSGRARGSIRLPLTAASAVSVRFNTEVGLSGRWDPND